MTHTPGPWEIHHYGDNEGDIHGSNGPLVCMMREGDTAPDQDWSADARLIAAAPELLEMLRRGADAVGSVEADCDEHGIDCYPARHWWQDADRLIAKAEGRE